MKRKYLLLTFLLASCGSGASESYGGEISSMESKSVSVIESSSEETTSSIESSSEETASVSESASAEFIYEDLFTDCKVEEKVPTEEEPYFTIDKEVYAPNESIMISTFNCGSKDWVGLYPDGGYPGDMTAISYLYANNEFAYLKATSYQHETKYNLYLCANDGYKVLDHKVFTVVGTDNNDYGVKEARYSYEENEMLIAITPANNKELTYEIYWAKDGKRLDDYYYVKSFTKASDKKFVTSLGTNLFMPNEANQLEFHVVDGNSTSMFIDVDDEAKIKSKYLYSFNVYSDLHVRDYNDKPNHVTHLQNALNDAYNYNKDSKGLFIVGDMTDLGSESNYECVTTLVDRYCERASVEAHYTLGNHEYINNPNFEYQLNLYKKYAKVDSVFYTLEMEGSTCIILGSDTNKGEGTISQEHIEWLKEQLKNANKDKPIYVFLHQPLINTTAGSYKAQGWYGIDTGEQIKEILASYPNTFLFAGHTHWEMESNNNIAINVGATSYINLASVGYLWNDFDAGEPGSEGIFVDVYEDCILIKGREFNKHKWLGYAMYCIPLVEQK